jgi:hypothetical protein
MVASLTRRLEALAILLAVLLLLAGAACVSPLCLPVLAPCVPAVISASDYFTDVLC